MRLALGDVADAQRDFNDWVEDCRSRRQPSGALRGHLEFLARFAAPHELAMND